MLALIQPHDTPPCRRVVHRVRFADELEALWYLRQDMLLALVEAIGESTARREMARINRLFKGYLPPTMVPRVHQRFSA